MNFFYNSSEVQCSPIIGWMWNFFKYMHVLIIKNTHWMLMYLRTAFHKCAKSPLKQRFEPLRFGQKPPGFGKDFWPPVFA